MSRNKVLIGIVVVVALSTLGFAGYQQFLAPVEATPTAAPLAQEIESIVSAQGVLVPRRRADLAFRTGGRVAEILVAEGQTVKEGDALIRLQDDELKAGLAQAQATLDLAKANLAQIEEGMRPEQIAQAEAAVRAAQANLAAAAAERDRLTGSASDARIAAAQANLAAAQVEQKLSQDAYDKIDQAGLTGTLEEQARFRLAAANQAVAAAQKALDEATSGSTLSARAAQASVAAALAQRDLAQAQLEELKNGPTESQLAVARAGVAQAEAAVQAAQAALDEATLRAPFDGTIAQITVDQGQVIAPGFVVAGIAWLDAWQVETDDLSEVDVVNVRVGQPVKITVDALPDVTLEGVVASITPRAETRRGDVTYTVTVDVQGDDPRALWGMTAQVEIQTQ
ncbi:MAG TPA: HlyD family efflux transporter periplasmic adaptor subunit [Anaerolineae bacterium]|nr:HlyD family efflux transporter periplasmic adaptor subunit [Anaerolineae bacterium]